MTFSSQPWESRYATMGDSSEQKFHEWAEGKCERWGLDRPKYVYVPGLPARVRACPDFLTSNLFVECLGIGRKQILQLKDEKYSVLRYWRTVMPVAIWVWDSHKKRSCLISLDKIERLINQPGVISIDYFDGRKLVFCIPADVVFEEADLTKADL